MRAWAVGLVLAWWFVQAGLQHTLAWALQRDTARLVATLVALALGVALQHRLRLGQRAKALPWAPVLLLAGAAAWLLFGHWVPGPIQLWTSPKRLYVEWGLSILLVLGTPWIALRLAAPSDDPTHGPYTSAPTLRLMLALGIVLGMCMAVWSPPWARDAGLSDLTQTMMRAANQRSETPGEAAWRWVTTLLPFLLSATLVWGAQLGPRILARRPGLTRITAYVALWALASVVVQVMAQQYSTAVHAPEGGSHFLVGALLAAMAIGPLLPLANLLLIWAVLLMLFTLGAAHAGAPAAAAPAPEAPPPAPPANTRDPASQQIKQLLAERRPDAALARYADELARTPEFDPGTSAVVPLTKQALKQGRAELALQLLAGFGRRRPADTATPLYRWLHGQALIAAGRSAEGLAALQVLMLSHPADPLAREARGLIARHRSAS